MVIDTIIESTAVTAVVETYLRSEERVVAFITAACDAIRAERKIIYYLLAPEGARVLRENMRHWLSRPNLELDLLSKKVEEAGPKLLIPTVSDGVRQVIMGKLSSQIADSGSEVLQTETPTIMAEVLRTRSAAIIRHSLREQIKDIVGASFRMKAV